MMTFLRCLVCVAIVTAVTATADISSCRGMKQGTTQCDPYSTAFLKVTDLQKGSGLLKRRPITLRKPLQVEKIRVKNGMTLHNLISKYIKREERLYYTEERRKEKVKQTELKILEHSPKAETNMTGGISPGSVATTRSNITPKEVESRAEKEPQKTPKATSTKPSKEVVVPSMKTPPVSISETVVAAKPVNPGLPPETEKAKPAPRKPETTLTPPPVLSTPVVKPMPVLPRKREENQSMEQESSPGTILPAEVVEKKEKKPVDINQRVSVAYATYVVKKGDSLIGIARQFGLKLDTLVTINKLGKKHMLREGQKLRVPIPQADIDAISSASYIVQKGDSLSKIARHFQVKVSDLKKYNKIRKKSVIHIGQVLLLPLPKKLIELKRIEVQKRLAAEKKKRERERLARSALKKEKRAKFLRASRGLKRKLSVTATAYTSHRGQTDSTPFLAAWNNRIRPGMKIIAVSHDLIRKYGITNGKKVRISGLRGIYTVRDKMNRKWRRKIDIYMGTSRWRALRWGRRRVTLYY